MSKSKTDGTKIALIVGNLYDKLSKFPAHTYGYGLYIHIYFQKVEVYFFEIT